MPRRYWVYILASQRNGTLYVDMTGDLARRLSQHRSGKIGGFTRKYGVHRLVWAEEFANVHDAIAAEKRLKRWRRRWKLELIERCNPQWFELHP